MAKAASAARPKLEPHKAPVSVITCDMEGRIETFNDGAAQIFGYSADEVIGKKRVSVFSPGEVVLGHVPAWLKQASTKGSHETDTVFIRKDGTRFAAHVRITPTFHGGRSGGQQVGFCGTTTVLEGVDPATVMPKTSLGVRIFKGVVIGRLPFLTASLVPVLLAAAWVTTSLGGSVAFTPGVWTAFALSILGMAFLHIAANIFNDYFDVKSGADPLNNDYFLPFTGGSRAVELGLTTTKRQFWTASTFLAAALACGVALFFYPGRPLVLAFGAAGALSGFFYTAPPLRLAARHGLGELFVGLNFGPLATAGAAYALRGSITPADFLVGIPVGLLTTAILWVNEFPDTPTDRAAGKVHLVATLGIAKARWGYLALLIGAFGTAVALALTGTAPWGSLLILLGAPIAILTATKVIRSYNDRSLAKASAGTIGLQLLSGLAAAAGLLWIH